LIDPACEQVIAVELPFDSIESDAQTVRRSLEELGPRTVVCGHSYGGRLLSIVADDTDAAHLVYLAAPAPNAEQFAAYATADRLRGGEVPDFASAWESFYNDCDERTALAAWEQLRPMGTPPGTTAGLEHRPWSFRPSTYVACLRDHALKPEVQLGMSQNMSFSATIESDHSPFLSAPEALAAILNDVLRQGHP
jgi:pimeloyl-ACP methyl ester carboxylesterase